MTTTMLRDDDGKETRAGDTIQFSFGIPPLVVKAKVWQVGTKLIAMTPTVEPKHCNLRSLRKYVGGWRKLEKENQT